jgi:hypothetical protein
MGKTPIYQMNEQNRQDIIKLQKHCPSFKHMYHFLKDGILPEDPDKAKSIPYEYNTYVLLNDASYHYKIKYNDVSVDTYAANNIFV